MSTNAPLDATSGNMTVGASVSAGLDLQSKGRGLGAELKFLWNNRIDAISKAGYQHKDILSKVFIADGTVNMAGFSDAQKSIADKRAGLKPEQMAELDTLSADLRALQLIQTSNTVSSDNKLTATALFLKAVVDTHEFRMNNKNSGIHMAGLTAGYSFLTGLATLGIDIQHIQAAYVAKDAKSDMQARTNQLKDSGIDTTLMAQQKKYVLDNTSRANDGSITLKPNMFQIVRAEKDITVTEGKLTPPTGKSIQLGILEDHSTGLSQNILIAKLVDTATPAAPAAAPVSGAKPEQMKDHVQKVQNALEGRDTIESLR